MKHDFKIGDKVTITKVKFTRKEWCNYFPVKFPFKIGDTLTIRATQAHKKMCMFNEDTNNYAYPSSCFLYEPPIKKIKSSNNKYLVSIIKELNKSYV